MSLNYHADISITTILVSNHGVDVIKTVVDNVKRILRHERLKYISYPYEWSFNQLKDAALLTLDLQIELLESEDITLSDNTAYNVQFDGCRAFCYAPPTPNRANCAGPSGPGHDSDVRAR